MLKTVQMPLSLAVQQARQQLFRRKNTAKCFLSCQRKSTEEFLLLQAQAAMILQLPLCFLSLQKTGADALLCVTPYYNKTSQAGLVKHFNVIADAVDLPIILYNVPSRTGCNIQPKTYEELCKHPNIVAAKEASGNISQVALIRSLCGDNLDIYSGNDDQTVPFMSLGALGVISVFANICPAEMHKICQLCLENDFAEAQKLHFHYLELMNIMFNDVNPIPIKTAMNLFGFDCGECRLPLVPMSAAGYHDLKDCLAKYDLLGKHVK